MLKVGVIDYVNVYPLTYHLTKQNAFSIYLEHPAQLGKMMQEKELDIAQIPVTTYLQNKDQLILLPSFCIAAKTQVKSVHLYHNIPIEDLKTIYVTNQSQSTLSLVKVLAMHHWYINCTFVIVDDFEELTSKEAFILIGDAALMRPHFEGYHTIDLCSSWYEKTNLPFVFALTCVQKEVLENYKEEVDEYQKALTESYLWGIENRKEVIKAARKSCPVPSSLLESYFNHFQFELEKEHLESVQLFEQFLHSIQPLQMV
jgi:chorismate dehydratase